MTATISRWAEARVSFGRWAEWTVVAAATIGLGLYVYTTRLPFVGPWRTTPVMRAAIADADRRNQIRAERYATVGAVLGPGRRVVTVAEEFGYPLEYLAGLVVRPWPRLADAGAPGQRGPGPSAEDRLAGLIAEGFTALVVTDFAEFDAQPDLRTAVEMRGRIVLSEKWGQVYELR